MGMVGAVRDRAVAAGRRHPMAVDAAVGAVIAFPYPIMRLFGVFEYEPRRTPASVIVAALVAFAGIAVRRRWPIPAFVGVAAITVGYIVSGHKPPVLMAAIVIIAFTMATRTDRRTAALLGGGAIVVLYVASVLCAHDGWVAPESLGLVAWLGMAVAAGDAVRTRRAYVAAVEERARRAEQTREEEARRRVAEERLRIARELHDVVAHHIAVINVQAGAAAHVLHERPEAVGPALARIRQASDTVVKELAAIVGVLRQPDDVTTEPTRGLARLEDLLDACAAAGLPVRHEQRGDARPLPAVVDLAAYRITQEALTNAHKHGAGGASLIIGYGPDDVTIEVTNPVRPDAVVADSGYGIVGMRERAAAAGGVVTAGPAGGGVFAVRACLPTVTS